MADRLTALRGGLRSLPVPVRLGLIYLAARLVTTAFFLAAAALSGPGSRFGVDPSLLEFALGWDAQWYWLAAVNGYPAELPLTGSGDVAENQWAFMPLFASAAAVVGVPFGPWGWGIGAVLIALVAGYGACLALHALLRPALDDAAATWAVVFFASGPLAAMFQVGYAESLFLLFLLLALRAVQRRRYGWLYALIPLMGYTRPGVLAFALLLGLVGVWRFTRRRTDPLPGREILHLVVLAALATAVGFSWQFIAAVVTGDLGAYLATELAWRRNWVPDAAAAFVPFEGFVQAAGFWFGRWGAGATTGYVVLLVLVAAAGTALVLERHVRRIGMVVRLWSASYLLYLLAVFFPQSSIFRLLLPLTPLWGAVAAPRSRAWRVGVLVLALLGQWWWIHSMYAVGNTYWQIP